MRTTLTEDKVLADIKVGDLLNFERERRCYTVQARSARYIVATKPFVVQRTVIYTIIDVVEKVRGPDDQVFCAGYETREQCEARLAELDQDLLGVSHRHSIALDLCRVRG